MLSDVKADDSGIQKGNEDFVDEEDVKKFFITGTEANQTRQTFGVGLDETSLKSKMIDDTLKMKC